MNNFERFTTKGGSSMENNNIPPGKTEAFSIEKYIECRYGKDYKKKLPDYIADGLEQEYIDDAKSTNVSEFVNNKVILSESTDGSD